MGASAHGLLGLDRLNQSAIGIDSSVTVESVGLAVSSVGINSTAARTVDCLSKSRSRRVFESLLVEVISLAFSARLESPRGRELFLPRPQFQDTEVSSALNATSTNLLLGRASADELARPAITEGRS
ncbi:hypothetical protein ACFX1Z_026472 [Malus domestica]